MIEAAFIFPSFAKRQVIESILRLPGPLCPNRMSVGEDEKGILVSDDLKSLDLLDFHKGGFFLKNKNCSYNINIVGNFPLDLVCFLEVPTPLIKILVSRLADCNPIFGFACSPDEREAKNRVRNKLDVGTIESWVGRDIDRSLPGIYWWTLLSSSLADKHGIPIAALSGVALEHIEVSNTLSLFRFYEGPEDWREATAVRKLTVTIPGIFDVEKARKAMASAKTFLEHSVIYRQWT